MSERTRHENHDRVRTGDGRLVEPYVLEGYFDRWSNYIPGYYDENGDYHLGYGYYDETGGWRVAYGYYRPDGTWVDTEQPVEQGERPTRQEGDDALETITDEMLRKSGARETPKDGDTLEVAHLWGDQVLAVETYPEPTDVTVGGARENDFTIDESELASDALPLVRWESGAYTLVISEEMSGTVSDGRREWSIAEVVEEGIARPVGPSGRYALSIGAKSSARLRVGSNEFVIRFVRMPAGAGTRAAPIDRETVPYYGISAAMHLAFLMLAMTLPSQAGALNLDRHAALDRFAGMTLQPEKEENEEALGLEKKKDEGAEKHAGPEGKAGKKEAAERDRRMAVKGPPETEEVKVKKARDRAVAMNAGAMKTLQNSQVSSMFSDEAKSVGRDAVAAIGHLDGDEPGDAAGSFGLGVGGPGRGGAGDDDSEGIGDLPVGAGSGPSGGATCKPYPECAKADLGENKGNAAPVVYSPPPDVPPSISKDLIRRVVRQHRRELKYCYESRLQVDPSLEGQMVVKFTISTSGDVISAVVEKSTVGDVQMEQCVTGKIRHWTFPWEDYRQVVSVNYPFNFARQ